MSSILDISTGARPFDAGVITSRLRKTHLDPG